MWGDVHSLKPIQKPKAVSVSWHFWRTDLDFVADSKACIAVLPNRQEPNSLWSSPLKLFEYMARARAVLAPRVEPIAMVMRDGESGLLFDSECAADLRAKLARAAGDTALRERLGNAARRDVREQHTWLMNARRVLAL